MRPCRWKLSNGLKHVILFADDPAEKKKKARVEKNQNKAREAAKPAVDNFLSSSMPSTTFLKFPLIRSFW